MMPLSYCESPLSARLHPVVECFWSIEALAAVHTGVPPDGCVDIIFSPAFGLRVVGTMTREQNFLLNAGTRIVGVRFRSGMARTVLGVPVTDLTDSFVPLEDLWPQRGKELKTRLEEARSVVQQTEAFRNAIQPPAESPNPVQRAIQAMRLFHGNVCLDDVASQANLSPRQFRRRCQEESGLAPKSLCRILRFRRAQQLARASSRPNWSRVAAEAGYFDQAHLIRDFQQFTGRTPMSVLSNTRSAPLP